MTPDPERFDWPDCGDISCPNYLYPRDDTCGRCEALSWKCRHCGDQFDSKRDLFHHLKEDECGWKGTGPIMTRADEIHEAEQQELALEYGGP